MHGCNGYAPAWGRLAWLQRVCTRMDRMGMHCMAFEDDGIARVANAAKSSHDLCEISVRLRPMPSAAVMKSIIEGHLTRANSTRSQTHGTVGGIIRSTFCHFTARPSERASVRPSVRPSDRPSGHPYDRPSIRPSIRPSDLPSARPSVHPTVRPSVRPPFRLSGRLAEKPMKHHEKPMKKSTKTTSENLFECIETCIWLEISIQMQWRWSQTPKFEF